MGADFLGRYDYRSIATSTISLDVDDTALLPTTQECSVRGKGGEGLDLNFNRGKRLGAVLSVPLRRLCWYKSFIYTAHLFAAWDTGHFKISTQTGLPTACL